MCISSDDHSFEQLIIHCAVGLQGMLKGADLSAAYASADIFMMPSETETLGFVALEAMASGLPVVAVAAGGLTDIITHPGVTSQSSSSPLTFPLLPIPIPLHFSQALSLPSSHLPVLPPSSSHLPPSPSPSPIPHPLSPLLIPILLFPPPHPPAPLPSLLSLLLDPSLSSSACAFASLVFASIPFAFLCSY